jgi:Flp pilus assembly pilin Flp
MRMAEVNHGNATQERGATMAEYAFMVTLIAMAAVGAVRLLGPAVEAIFRDPRLLGSL